MMGLSYHRHRFPPVVIQHAVWLYLRFTLSYRDVEDLLAERGFDVSYETVRSWVLKFGPVIARRYGGAVPAPAIDGTWTRCLSTPTGLRQLARWVMPLRHNAVNGDGKSQSPYKREVRRWELECGDHWGGDDVFLDPAHASDRFRRDPQRVPFFTKLVLGNPEMNNTVAHNNVLWPDLRPLLTAEFGKEPGSDRAIVSFSFGGCCTLRRSDRAHNICAADDPNNFAFAHYGHALNSLCF